MRYTLRQLEVFLATAHFENVTKAAQSLAMSQSAASGALKDLEQQFDMQLFDRVGKRLQANEQGLSLRPKAQALIEQARALEQELVNHKDIGHIKVGATLTIGNYLAVGLMAEFMRENPSAEIQLEVANTEAIAKQVLNFDLDLGLIEGEFHHADLEVSHWRDDELVVFCAPNHPLAAKQVLTDQDLLAADWILRETGSGTRQGFDRAMHGLLAEQTIKLELQHTEAIKRAVEAGLGISCLSRITLEDAFQRGNLVPLLVPHRDFHRAFYVILHKNKYRSTGIQRWLALCTQ
ncbi:LysR family transcriptional regulator [Oceanicoccus sagamiensis]|uniref:LysR family transcriptional regulator n=1 Tax=Oceanicoccus sagamiensis TaxID=716816 RepID=A0A1X9N7B7_9GAMM|nr:LysR family transcriptional regulator [Oceanicoccus sagamiensis]ARN73970.1 LysR family transcriptional regulator [Oceanicoccus sagamiensis]